MSNVTSNKDIDNLFNGAKNEGQITPESMKLLMNLGMGARFKEAMGVPAIDAQTSEVIMLTILVDDSGSIAMARNEQLVRDGCNQTLDAMMATKQKEAVQVSIRYINGTILTPYVPLEQAPRLDGQNYIASGQTPLYDESAATYATVLAKTLEFSNVGIPVRAITITITDGADMGSVKYKARDIKPLVTDMLKAENQMILAMGISDGSTDFRQVFTEMGLTPESILTPGNSAHEIRQAFKTASQSAVRASQTANFHSAAMGGFGATPTTTP